MKLKVLILTMFICVSAFGQLDITKRKITVDTVRARVDSLYLKGNISVNGVNFYSLFSTYGRDSVYQYFIDSFLVDRQELGDTATAIRSLIGTIPDNVMTFSTSIFNDTISFKNNENSYKPYTVSTNIIIKQDTINSKYTSTATFAFIGNGINTLTFPTNWRNTGDLSFNNTNGLINYGVVLKRGDRITYVIDDTLLSDLSPPVLDSAWQTDSTKVYLLFTENLNQDSVSVMPTSAITLTGATVSSFTGSNADTLIVNLSSNAVATAVSYTQPAIGKIQDASGNLTANWTDSTVYNNIPPVGDASLTINLTTNITKSGDDYTATGGSGFVNYCLFNEFLASSTDGYLILEYNSTGDGTLILGFDAANTNKDYNSYDYALYLAQSNGDTRAITNGSLGSTIQTSSIGSKFKLQRLSGSITIQYASDGINFSTIHTFGTNTGTFYVNLNLSNGGDDCRQLKHNGLQ
jgi:hypothetical protein